ncbi:MAG: glycosyltransferase [Anaerolineales bacterium]|nr:glycosyltransferase [Anaerolineales bacterium]
MQISVIMTVLNEGEAMRAVLDSLAAQTWPADEIVVCDGGSRDATLSVLRGYAARLPLKIVEVPGANISQGRNAALRAASGEIIAVTDAGVRCEPDWLEKLVEPFTPLARAAGVGEGPGVRAVAGFFHSDPKTVFEIALGATTLPEAREINPQTYLPSSRSVAFRKEVWERVGGYPEWLDFCEDVIFDLNVRREFGPFAFQPAALVHFRPRASLRAFAKQYYQYARGDGKANLFPRQHAVRYFAYWVAAPLLIYAALTVSPWLWLLGILAGVAYIRLPLRRAASRLPTLTWWERVQVLVLIPIIRVTGDGAKMLGYPVGVWWRLQKKRPTA